MAESPAHKWGQIIGEFLEEIFKERLQVFANQHNLYLDSKGDRPARKGKKVSWKDHYGNSHDLDFVLEKGGTDNKIGSPVAFIECAWRRYTKHSRNKAQEIQGAVMPLVAMHRYHAPLFGAIIAGAFTNGAITQLRSLGFKVLYFSYASMINAFHQVGIDAKSEEDTSVLEFEGKIRTWEHISAYDKAKIANHLFEANHNEIQEFFAALEQAVTRYIERVIVIPLHGRMIDLGSIQEAITFIEQYNHKAQNFEVLRYEIQIRYNNGDMINGSFARRDLAVGFLKSYEPFVVGDE